MLSESSRRMVQQLSGRVEEERVSALPRAGAWTLVKVRDPMQPLEDVVARLDGPIERPPNRWLQRQRYSGDLGADEMQRATFAGRVCCARLAAELDRMLARLTLPSEHTCPECGTVWALEQRVREERPHGR